MNIPWLRGEKMLARYEAYAPDGTNLGIKREQSPTAGTLSRSPISYQVRTNEQIRAFSDPSASPRSVELRDHIATIARYPVNVDGSGYQKEGADPRLWHDTRMQHCGIQTGLGRDIKRAAVIAYLLTIIIKEKDDEALSKVPPVVRKSKDLMKEALQDSRVQELMDYNRVEALIEQKREAMERALGFKAGIGKTGDEKFYHISTTDTKVGQSGDPQYYGLHPGREQKLTQLIGDEATQGENFKQPETFYLRPKSLIKILESL